MSRGLIDRSPDLRTLEAEGYCLRIADDTFLVIDRVPYVTAARNDDRKPCGTVPIFRSVNTLDRPMSVNTLPRAVGNTSGWPSPSVRAASRISTARPPGCLGLSHVQPRKHYPFANYLVSWTEMAR